jgi:hypothetical protein
MVATNDGSVLRVEEVPNEHHRVITARGEHPSPRRIPFNGVYRCRVASELKEGLARLAHVEYADEIGVGGKGCEQVGVVRRRGEAEKGRSIGHGLLRFGRRHAAW